MLHIGRSRLELALFVLIAVLCSVLSVLQYRWTGDLSRAERARLRAGLTEQVGRLTRAFDDELRHACRALVPDAAELREQSMLNAHTFRYQQWAASHDPSVFQRIAIAVPERGELSLLQIQSQGRILPIEWPAGWETLRDGMTARLHGAGSPPSVPPNSTLIEFPVFDNAADRGSRPTELEWMIFEVSEDHLRTKTLPLLVAEYLDSGNDAVYDVSVSWSDSHRPVIFSTRHEKASVAPGADLTAGIFSSNIAGLADRHQRRSGGPVALPRWTLAVRHREGSLDAAVSRVRTRNLVTSLLLIGLLAGAAWALVRYTARSRRLAEMQFRFAVGVSHNLRTPLTAIRGAAFNLADGVSVGARRHSALRHPHPPQR